MLEVSASFFNEVETENEIGLGLVSFFNEIETGN